MDMDIIVYLLLVALVFALPIWVMLSLELTKIPSFAKVYTCVFLSIILLLGILVHFSELILVSLPIALFIASIVWGILSYPLTRTPSFAKVFICTFLCVFIPLKIAGYIANPIPPSHTRHAVSALRSMQAAVMSFYADNQDSLSEIPIGSNIVEYLQQYLDWQTRLSNNGPYIFMVGGDHRWWVGLNMGQSNRDRRATYHFRRRAAVRARSVGLFGTSELTPPPSLDDAYLYAMEDFAWMSVRSDLVSRLRSIQKAAQSFYAANRDVLSEIPRDSNIIEYLERYLEHPFGLNSDGFYILGHHISNPYIFIISDDNLWVGRNLANFGHDSGTRRRFTEMASSLGFFGSSEPTPPVSADVVYRYNMDDFVWMFVREEEF